MTGHSLLPDTSSSEPDFWHLHRRPLSLHLTACLLPQTQVPPQTFHKNKIKRTRSINVFLKAEHCSQHLSVSSVHQIWYKWRSRSCRPEKYDYLFFALQSSFIWTKLQPVRDPCSSSTPVPILLHTDRRNPTAGRSEIVQSRGNHPIASMLLRSNIQHNNPLQSSTWLKG